MSSFNNVTLTDEEVSGICDIIDGTIDSVRGWGSEEEIKSDLPYWIGILEKLDPERAANWSGSI